MQPTLHFNYVISIHTSLIVAHHLIHLGFIHNIHHWLYPMICGYSWYFEII
jgi:hypothetical protein